MIKGGESVSDVSGVFYPLFIIRIIQCLQRDFFLPSSTWPKTSLRKKREN